MLISKPMRIARFPKSPGALVIAALVLVLAAFADTRAEPALRIAVWKSKRQLWLSLGDKVIRRYSVSLGKEPRGSKEARGDGRTPVGVYYVSEKRPRSKYHRFLALSYPGIQDAERAFAAGRITADTWADIWLANTRGKRPPADTVLGGFVGIHGTGGNGRQGLLRQLLDWTDGCVALSDRDVEELYESTPVGTPVEIFE